jgi:lipopolysaccharide export system protein LptC
MNTRPITANSPDSPGPALSDGIRHRAEAYLIAASARMRRLPTAGGIARRRWAINVTKFLLPAAALALLTTLAMWPELERASEEGRRAMARLGTEIQSGQLIDARYRGVDDKGRPYTLTAATAHQVDPIRIDLTNPKGDITMADGTWLMLQSKLGTFMQHINQLDLRQDVTLYRDDGLTLTTASASVDIKNGAAAGSEPVHAEGPFGTLDAKNGFTVVDKGAAIQFAGPAHVILNGATPP